MTGSVEIPDAAVEAAAKAVSLDWRNYTASMRIALVAARPYLMPLLDREAIDRRLETAKGHGWSIETTVDAVMELARAMPTREQISAALSAEVRGWPDDAGLPHHPDDAKSVLTFRRLADAVLALLNGGES